ncbi:hypothetical protein [Deinococcus sonorensis]|uniref:Zinc finger CGNR domain-containing protein n=2 Tax=Deinococcus sonorensis TaxID=309891 RepID=A0AAU7UD54_9DEIO
MSADVLVPGGSIEDIYPLQDKNLWLKFAIDNASKDAVIDLCRRYGFLFNGFDQSERFSLWEEISGERYYDWIVETGLLFIAKNIYFCLIEGDIYKAKTFLPRPDRKHLWWYTYTHELRPIEYCRSEEDRPRWNRDFEAAIQEVEERELWCMLSEITNTRVRHSHLSMIIDDSHNKLSMRIKPLDLCAAIWIQFSQAIARRVMFKQCVHCNKEFAVSGFGSHKDRQLCSNSCKQAAYRERKKTQARRLG